MKVPHENPFGRLTDGRSLLGAESLLFVLLSAADLFMTYSLMRRGRFYESNPVAQWFFEQGNIAGLTLFKFGLVILIIVLSETIERHRPRLGRAILLLGCVAAAAVTCHGYRLGIEHG